MHEPVNLINTAYSIQELGITGILALSNALWIWIAKKLWQERNDKERQLHDCLEAAK